MQAVCCLSSPEQDFPELAGVGSSHWRDLTLVPSPHVLLQELHDDQRPQWPSTGAVLYIMVHKLWSYNYWIMAVAYLCSGLFYRILFKVKAVKMWSFRKGLYSPQDKLDEFYQSCEVEHLLWVNLPALQSIPNLRPTRTYRCIPGQGRLHLAFQLQMTVQDSLHPCSRKRRIFDESFYSWNYRVHIQTNCSIQACLNLYHLKQKQNCITYAHMYCN